MWIQYLIWIFKYVFGIYMLCISIPKCLSIVFLMFLSSLIFSTVLQTAYSKEQQCFLNKCMLICTCTKYQFHIGRYQIYSLPNFFPCILSLEQTTKYFPLPNFLCLQYLEQRCPTLGSRATSGSLTSYRWLFGVLRINKLGS